MKYISRKADLVITISKNEKDRIIEKGYSKNVDYVYHGIDNNENIAKVSKMTDIFSCWKNKHPKIFLLL